MKAGHCKVVVLISGTGSNLQALMNASKHSNFRISAVISNNPDARGIEKARHNGIATAVCDHRQFTEREEFDRALMHHIDHYRPDLLVLAGFMRILGREFVTHFSGRIVNIHPSLLPRYPGINTHQRVLEAGDKVHGVSVHFVTEELDAGAVIAQDRVAVLSDDTAESLAARVLEKEHLLYPEVVSWFAAGRLRLENKAAVLDGDVLQPGGVQVPSR